MKADQKQQMQGEEMVVRTIPESYDFVVLESGYTSHIAWQKPLKDLQQYILEHLYGYGKDNQPVVYIKDTVWGNSKTSFSLLGKQEDADFVQSVLDRDGVIVLKNMSWCDLMCAVEALEKLEFCAHFNISEMYKIQFITYKNKTIFYAKINACHG